ncbi:hypothetical protein PoMZ_01683 [Pyricularia oryzae]|uniref:Uncharacterized protein n=1 Tax=Pyricularia oryzae TaxID=318829 RepID=A0A4P7N2U1_PYROR|nr:hypothetical protein PoMZ_01683 [Pyricularia oryzae]
MLQQQIQAPPGSGHLAVFQKSKRTLEITGDAFSLDNNQINFTQNTAKLNNMGILCAYSILKENQIRPNFSKQSLLPSNAWQSPPVVTFPNNANLQFDADVTIWVSGGSIYEQSSLLIANCASLFLPVQTIGPNQPSLLIKPHTSFTAAFYNVATYPIILSGPQSQIIFFVSQPEPYI